MAIVKCEGPQGQPGVRFEDPESGAAGKCFTWERGDRAGMMAAFRAVARESNAVASGGDPRMARDG